MSHTVRWKVILQALLVTFLWSTSWVLIKIGLRQVPAITFAGLRYGLATLILMPLFLQRGLMQKAKALPPRRWFTLVALGIVGYALAQGSQFLALAYLPAVTVNLILSLTTVLVALSGIPLLRERPGGWQWLGIGLAVAGAFVYFSPATLLDGLWFGFLAAGVGLLANVGASLLGREVNRRADLPPLLVTTLSMGAGSALLLFAGLGLEGLPPLGWTDWAIIAWLAVVNSAFAFTLWNKTQQTLTAVESSIINNTMMIQIPILAVIFLGERPSGLQWFGLGVAALGTLLVQLRRPRRKAAPTPEAQILAS